MVSNSKLEVWYVYLPMWKFRPKNATAAKISIRLKDTLRVLKIQNIHFIAARDGWCHWKQISHFKFIFYLITILTTICSHSFNNAAYKNCPKLNFAPKEIPILTIFSLAKIQKLHFLPNFSPNVSPKQKKSPISRKARRQKYLRDGMRCDFMSIGIEILNLTIVRPFMADKKGCGNRTAIWILSIILKDFFVQIAI